MGGEQLSVCAMLLSFSVYFLMPSVWAAGPTLPEWGPCDPGACLDLHMIYTSKLGGRFLPVTSRGQTCDPADSSRCYGGSARRAAYVEERRREYSSRNESTVFMDLGGSTFGGPLWEHPDYPRGGPATMLQNLLPYDFCAFSPRDFMNQDNNESLRELPESFAARTCPFLVANARFNGLWAGFNARVTPWAVKEMQNGWKVAFIGMMPRVTGYGFKYGPEVATLDPRSLLSRIVEGSYSELGLEVAGSSISSSDPGYRTLDPYTRSVVLLASVAPVDVLAAQAEARRAHPDLKATVVLVGDKEREDQVRWLAEFADIDVVLREYRQGDPTGPEWVQSLISPKQVLVAGGETVLGVGQIKVRLHPTLGVQKWHVEPDFGLDSTVAGNATVHAAMDSLYEGIRRKNSQPYGTITNPLVGGYKGAEAPPSKKQCFYMDCNVAEVVGAALLWKALSGGYETDVSLYNVGGIRDTLVGDANATVFMSHCNAVLKFQNALKLFKILGRDLYESIKSLMRQRDRGLVGAGVRVSFHEPCFSYVNHTSYAQDGSGAPGHSGELDACKAETGLSAEDTNIEIIDIEVRKVDWARCRASNTLVDCVHSEWRPLEKGTTYTLASTDYLAGVLTGYRPMEIALGIDAEALCSYIGAHSPLDVETWERYAQRGGKQYARAEDGWAQGMRVVSVQTAVSHIAAAPTCPDGMYLHPLATACQPCRAGRSSSLDAARASCIDCVAGFYSNASGASRCSRCPAGSFSNETASTSCRTCSAGEISEAGASSCIPCQEGQFSPTEASKQCMSCAAGKYSSTRRSSACIPCGGDLVTRHPGMVSAAECVCPAGTYLPLPATAGGNTSSLGLRSSDKCFPCPLGMECPLGSDMRFVGMERRGVQQHPVLLPQHWSSGESPLSVFECRSEKRCPGGSPGDACARGLAGQACERCEDNSFWNGEECRECINSFVIFPGLPVLLLPVVVVVLYHKTKAPLAKWNSWSNALGLLFFITLNHYQIIALLRNVNVKVPDQTKTTLSFWRWTGDAMQIFSANCIGFSDFTSRVLRGSLTPLVVVLIALGTLPASRLAARQFGRPSWAMSFAGLHNVIGSLLFTFFNGIANQALTLFKCQGNPNGKITLGDDASVNCFEAGVWQSMLVVGILSVLVYCVFLGALYIRTVLVAHRSGNFQNPDFQLKWKFLFVKYRADVYWFGVVFLLKNFLINLAFVAVRTDLAQLMWVLTVVITYTGLVAVYMPFRYWTADIMELTVSASLVFNITYLIWFSDRSNSEVLQVATRVISFVPVGAFVPCALLTVRSYWRQRVLIRSTLSLFDRVKASCAALVHIDSAVGGAMLMDLQEGDRQMMASFCNIVEAEVMGVPGNRLVTGILAANSEYQGEISMSKDLVRTATLQLNDEEGVVALRGTVGNLARGSSCAAGGSDLRGSLASAEPPPDDSEELSSFSF